MKKILVICLAIFNWLLQAEIGENQLDQLDFFLSPFKRGVEICKEKGFTHFLVKKIIYEGERGQSLVFKGISDIKGDALVSETLTKKFAPYIGTITLNCEFVLFKNDPLAIESSRYQSYSDNSLQKLLMAKHCENNIEKTQPWEKSVEIFQNVRFPDAPEVVDQFTQFASVLLLPFRSILPNAAMYNAKYFLIKKISFKDARGQSLVFKGVSNVQKGILISDNQIEKHQFPLGTINVESEIFFFEEFPNEPLVIGIEEWLGNNED